MANHEVIISGAQEYRTRQLDFGVVHADSGVEAVL
jgi:hypothetical protein